MKTDETMTGQTLVSISMKIDGLEIKSNNIFDKKVKMAVISSILDEFRRGKEHSGVLDSVEYESKVENSRMRPCLAVQRV